jgi:hypothetical protein
MKLKIEYSNNNSVTNNNNKDIKAKCNHDLTWNLETNIITNIGKLRTYKTTFYPNVWGDVDISNLMYELCGTNEGNYIYS